MKICLLTLAVALCLPAALPTVAQEASPTLDKIKASGKIAIGYRESSVLTCLRKTGPVEAGKF